MFEQAQQECDLVLFNNLVYLAEQQGHSNPSAWVVDKLCSLDVETTTARQEDNCLTLIRSKGYTQEIHNQILAELDPQMTPEAMVEAFHLLVANAASCGRSKQWVIDSLTEVGATIISDDEIDLMADHITAVENLIDPPVDAEASDEDLQIQYKALEARAELVGLDADALSQNHGAINPDYELTPFVLAELTRQVDQWEKAFGPGANETIATIDGKPVELTSSSAEVSIEVIPEVDPKQSPDQEAPGGVVGSVTEQVGETSATTAQDATAEPVKKKGRKSKANIAALITKAMAELQKALQAIEAEGGDDV